MMNQEQQIKQSNHIVYFDYLRILATLTVIMLHAAASNWLVLDYTTTDWKIHNFFDGAARWAVPVFIMMSGALFLNPAKEIPLGQMYRKYVLPMVITFVVWSVLYAVADVLRSEGASFLFFASMVVRGHYHMWFILLISSLYMVVPLLRKITADTVMTRYLVLLGIIMVIIVPRVLFMMEQLLGPENQLVVTTLTDVFHYTHFPKASEYVLYFILGYVLHTTELKPVFRWALYGLGCICLGILLLLTDWAAVRNGMQVGWFYEPKSFNVLVISSAAFVFGKYELSRLKLSAKAKQAVQYIAKRSFTMYLVHAIVLEILNRIGLHTRAFHAALSIPALTLAGFVISLVLAVAIDFAKSRIAAAFTPKPPSNS